MTAITMKFDFMYIVLDSSLVYCASFSSGSGGRVYNTAPGAEGTYRNNLGPSSSMQGTGAGGMFSNHNRPNKEPMNMGRSRLLEEFRSNRIPNLQLKDLTNHVVEFSQDQHGSR